MDTLLYIRNPDLSRVAAIKNPKLVWIRRWHKAGRFELTIPYRKDIGYDHIISKGAEAGVVRGIVVETTDKDGDVMEVTGPLLAGYAYQRLVWGTQTISDTPEAVMKGLVARNMCEGTGREFVGLTVETAQGLAGEVMDYQATDAELGKELEQLAENSGLGFDIVLAGDGMMFRVLEGLDRTASQAVNPRAIFGIERNNLLSAEFEQNGEKYTNVAKISNDLYTEVHGTAAGYERYEIFVNPSQVEKDEDGNENTEAQQRALMQQQGAQKLTPITRSFIARIDPEANLKYKTHYDLGDIVTCQVKRWGVSVDMRITEIKEIYTGEGFGLEITFGTGQLSYSDNIRRITNG